jgi:hypothetical protein
MVNKTLYEVCLKSIMKGGNIGNEIYEYIVIGVIIICLIVFGPALYNFFNILGKVAGAGDKVIGGAINLAGDITEGMAYCYSGSKNPSKKCDDATKQKAEKSYTGTGGFNICNNCTPPCLLKDIKCTGYDIAGITVGIFGALAFFSGIYCRVSGNEKCASPKEALKDAAGGIKDLMKKAGGKALDKIKDAINRDPDGPDAKRAKAEQDRKDANKKRKAADKARQEANDNESDADAQSKAKEAEKEADEADAKAKASEDDADDAEKKGPAEPEPGEK